MKKTNAARIADHNKIEYEIYEYKVDENDLSAVHVSKETGQPIDKIFKTLVLQSNTNEIVVVCIPGKENLNLKSLAKLSGHKKVEMIHLKDVQKITGYIRGGVSPIGMKKLYPTFIHESAFMFDKIFVSAGLRGKQLYIKPDDLLNVTKAKKGNLIV
ncbi:Cys-tRNA(Pro) deacylase [Lutibacter sp. B2]|nr:Cys-tRNA(Pro) deacylase [Lutibacter sp. B2]